MQYMSQAVTFRIPDELAQRLRGQSERSGTSQTFMVVTALTDYLEAIEWQQEQLAAHRKAIEKNPAHKNVTLDEGGSVVVRDTAKPASMSATTTYRCPRDCDPTWRPLVSTARCDYCRSAVVPAFRP